MNSRTLVYLPGLHGTADLADSFFQAVPSEIKRRSVVYPFDEPLNYQALLERISNELQDETEMVILGESFAGPLALMFAAANPQRVAAVVLVATFARHPLPSWLRHVAPIACRLPLPDFVIRFLLTGPKASDDFVAQVRAAIRKPTAAVLSLRLKSAFKVDCTESLKRIGAPIIYIAPTHDHLVPRSSLKRIRAIRPDVDVQPINGPHLILQTAPTATWNAIQRLWSP